MKTHFFYLLKLVAGALGVVACSGGANRLSAIKSIDDNLSPDKDFMLKPFVSCSQLEDYVENNAIKIMKSRLHNSRYKVWMNVMESTNSADLLNVSDYTTTNNQVEGVEEADILKNNGSHIFTISDKSIKIVKSWPAAETQTVATIVLPEKPNKLLLLKNNKLVVISEKREVVDGDSVASEIGLWMNIFRPANYSSLIFVYDVSKPESPKLVYEYTVSGRISHARNVGESVQLIAEKNLVLPKEVVLYYDFNDSDPDAKAKLDQLVEKNIGIIKGKDLDFWLGNITFTENQARFIYRSDRNVACTNSYREGFNDWTSTQRIINLNFDDQFLLPFLDQRQLLARINSIHRARNSLYVTRNQWINTEEDQYDRTIIHKFSIPDVGSIKYVASGAVDGKPVDEFAMDEYKESFRIATTKNHWKLVKDANSELPKWDSFLSNNLYVLQNDKSELKTVGETKPFELNERIYSVRFAGNKAFVVTFRQVDPLLTVDLEDNLNPKIVGSLKIPGFSTYIHLIDDTHLLTIGEYIPEPDANGNVNRAEQCLKLALFDVSNFAMPRELSTYKFPVGAWSDARFEHKAFTYFKAQGLLAIPLVAYNENDNYDEEGNSWSANYDSSLELFKIDANYGISKIGSTNINELASAVPQNWPWWYDNLLINRSIFVKDYIFAVTNRGIKVANINSLETPVALVNFSENSGR